MVLQMKGSIQHVSKNAFCARMLILGLEEKYQQYLRACCQAEPSQRSIVNFATTSSLSPGHSASVITSYTASSARVKQITESLIKNLIIGCGLPVALVDYAEFRQFMRDMDPRYDPPCRQTVTYSHLRKMLDKMK